MYEKVHELVWIKLKGMNNFNRNRETEYSFSISDTSGTITSVETGPTNMALVCVPSTSVTNSQNLIPVTAEPWLSTPSTILRSATSSEEINSSTLLKISPVQKIQRKHKFEKIVSLFFLSLKNQIQWGMLERSYWF